MTAPLPPVTVVTPAYNCERYIVETVESVLAQDHPDFEYIVVDDGSTDGTPALLRPYRDRITLLRQANRGESAAVNRAVELASHDIVGIVNADDPVLPGLLTGVARALAADPSLAAVYPDWLKIDEAGRVLEAVTTCEFDYQAMVAQHFCMPGPGAFFRRRHLEEEPARDPALAYTADYDLWLRLGLRGGLRRIPATLATWRQHPGGASSRFCPAMAEDLIAVTERFFARTDLPAAVRAAEDQAISAAYFHAALIALRSRGIPARRYLWASLRRKPVWPPVIRSQRRAVPHACYAALQPFSGWAHDKLSPLLPPPYRREAVLTRRFGRRPHG